jgi:two-component system phosphate regulon sensor histidine kinase PhoR
VRLTFRARLIALSVLLVVVAWGAAALYLEATFREVLIERVEADLTRHTRLFAAVLARRRPNESPTQVAHALSVATDVRLTLVDADGTVRAESGVDEARVVTLPSHALRPEVQDALATGHGRARRWSETVSQDLLYVATRLDDGRVARAAMPLAEVDGLITRARIALVIGGLLAMVVAFFMSIVSSWLATRALERVVVRARSLALSRQTPGIDMRGDDIEALAGSFDRMTDELRHAMQGLAKERDRLEAVIEGMDDGVVALNWEGRIRVANRAFARIVGRGHAPTAQIVDEKLVDLLPHPDLVAFVRGQTGADSVELELPRKKHVDVRRTKLRSTTGSVLVFHDVTETRRIETMRKDFVANVSHELRTPIAIVQANVEALVSGALEEPDRARTFLDALQRNALRLSRLVDDLLDLARIESGAFQAKASRVRVADVVGKIADTLADTIATLDHEVTLELSDDAIVWADEGALEHVLVNLVENAAKYTPKGGHITLGARVLLPEESLSPTVRIEVKDDGPGVPEEHRERIFERFYRVDAGRSKEAGGTGLGLSIVKHLVLAMGGEIGVHENVPHGAVFTVDLPQSAPGIDARADQADS